MTSTTNFKTTARAALAAFVIGSASLAAMPAQAQGTANFGFSFNSGNGLSFSITEGQGQRKSVKKKRHQRACLNNQSIRRDLRNSGFRNISFNNGNNNRVRVSAVRGRWVYKLRVNRCNGNVATLDRKRVHVQRQHRPAGLNLQFNFR